MASKFFERRSIRVQLKNYLESKGWTNLTWAEGFSVTVPETINPPHITLTLDDLGTDELEIGRDPSINKVFSRRLQVDVFMEDENRVSAITDDIADFLDLEVIIIKDNSDNILGSMVSDTSSIMSDVSLFSYEDELNLEFAGVVTCMYSAHYPNG